MAGILESLTRAEWRALDDVRARALIAHVAQAVDARVLGLRPGGGPGPGIAMFELDETELVLVPGENVRLGFDGRSFVPTAEQRASYENEHPSGLPETVEAAVDLLTSTPRTAVVRPLLVEVEAAELGPETIDPEREDVRAVLAELHDNSVEVWEGSRRLRVEKLRDGRVSAFEIVPMTHDELVSDVTASGMRLLGADEWEYVCGAGAATLFRWGNDCPRDRYPTDPGWRRHREPNAFGLAIASNPYRWEVIAAPRHRRGGDGGSFICGGGGYFLAWLTLATAFVAYDMGDAADAPKPDDVTGAYVRRAIEL